MADIENKEMEEELTNGLPDDNIQDQEHLADTKPEDEVVQEMEVNEAVETKVNEAVETKVNEVMETKVNEAVETKVNEAVETKVNETLETKGAEPVVERPPSPQAAQMGPVVTGPGGRREQKLYIPAKLNSEQQEALAKAKKYAMEQSIKSVLLKQTIVHQQQMANFQNALQRPFTIMGSMQITEQVWTKLGTIYVGSINFDVREDTVKNAFQPFGPIKNVSLSWDAIANKHKGFAFVEYDVPEAATLALEQMNGVMLGGRNIKVGRPSNMPQAQPIIEKLMEEAKAYNRIYVASIHPDLSESDVQSVFEAFGAVRSCKLAADMLRPGKHRGYGFIEYDTAQAAFDAVSSMNLFNLGGQYLRVGKAVTPPSVQQIPSFPTSMPTAAAVAAAAVTAKITAMDAVLQPIAMAPPGVAIPQIAAPSIASPFMSPGIVIPQLTTSVVSNPITVTGMSHIGHQPIVAGITTPSVVVTPAFVSAVAKDALRMISAGVFGNVKKAVEEEPGQTLAQQENIQISGSQARHMVMQKLMRKTETRVMILRNMVGAEEVDEDLESEVIDECSKYGSVNRVIIYQEKQSEDEDAEVLVKIFVEFHSAADSEKAIKALDGRFFAGRQVKANSYEQELFDANDLSG